MTSGSKSKSLATAPARRARWLRWWLGVVGLLFLILLASGLYFRNYFAIHSRMDAEAYLFMPRSCHPIWRDLPWRRIQAGEDAEALIAPQPPYSEQRFGEYTYLEYCLAPPKPFTLGTPVVCVVARNGKIEMAFTQAFEWGHIFFRR